MALDVCPMCGKALDEPEPCRINDDGESGYCMTEQQGWKLQDVDPRTLLPGPIQHESLEQPLLEIARWTFRVLGRFVYPAFEQWELGFLRDMHPAREIGIWARYCNAFADFASSQGRSAEDLSEAETRLLLSFLLRGDRAASLSAEEMERHSKGDASTRERLEDLNSPANVRAVVRCMNEASALVPESYIEGVDDRSLRVMLRDFNRALTGKPTVWEERVQHWISKIESGEEIPVVKGRKTESGDYEIFGEDAHCRVEAMQRLGRVSIGVEIVEGTPEEIEEIRRQAEEEEAIE